ncbi:MAG: FtsX-like permease family protein [Gammaproteobacteria bacterium]
MSPLNKKLLRNIHELKVQLLAIVLVMAAGISFFIILFGVIDSLHLTKSTYYERYQFANVFASLKRAPNSVRNRIETIEGVSAVETRVVFGVTLQMPNMNEPASGKVISYDENQLLNNLYLHAGRWLFPDEEDAVLVDKKFFESHNLNLGDSVLVIMNAHQRQLKIVGVVLSPEYVYAIAPGSLMPDSKRFGIFWMNSRPLEAAINMRGAFNDLSVKVDKSANIDSIKSEIDLVLKPYGGLISYGRDQQLSNFFIENEITQLRSMAFTAPFVFLTVAAFLINIVLSRLISTQRTQIGMLKALGYNNFEITGHFLKLVLVIASAGTLIGLLLGFWMGRGAIKMYAEFFQFPILKYSFSPTIISSAILICTLAAVSGAVFAIRKSVKLPPAEAMRPESPAVYKQGWLEKLGIYRFLSLPEKIILRQIERRPIRAFLSSFGLSLATALLIFGFFMYDTMQYMLDVQYGESQREDVNIAFVDSRSENALEELKLLPGVLSVEPLRNVSVEFKNQNYKKTGSITGLVPNPELRRIINAEIQAVSPPETGLVMNEKLAKILHIKPGDLITVDVLQDKRQVKTIPVVATTSEFIGLSAFMNIDSLNKMLDDPPLISGASLRVDENHSAILYEKIKEIPVIAGLNIISVVREIFEELMAENLLQTVTIIILFSCFISFGVIYNTARITLSERGKELSTLRILGFTKKETAYVLFGELGLIALISFPLGIVLGDFLSRSMVESLETELFRIPYYVNSSTFAFSVLIVMLSTVFSLYLVWKKLKTIDLAKAQKAID